MRGTAGRIEPRIWAGTVWHERAEPTHHHFEYRMWWADLDLDELDKTFGTLRALGPERGRPLRFDRSDYLGDPDRDLATEVRDLVEARTGDRPDGPVRLLGHLRTFGWCFNPIVLYLCHRADGSLAQVVADVTNTPWKERHQYVLPADRTGVHGHIEDKALHVSPYMGMNQQYRFDIDVSDHRLRVRIVTLEGDGEPFAAGVTLAARPMTDRALAATLIRHPLLTIRVSLGIHTQALRLFRKGVPVHRHPDQSREEVSTP
jgi:uncharacterized protein